MILEYLLPQIQHARRFVRLEKNVSIESGVVIYDEHLITSIKSLQPL
jgi:hypothetical protein